MNQTRILSTYLMFSSIAAILLILVVGTTPSQTPLLSVQEKFGITALYVLCCGLGISFTIRPNWVRRYFLKHKNEGKTLRSSDERSFQGHHPDCPTFQNHTIYWRQKTWCAGCLGLFIGLWLSIVFMILFMMTDFQLTKMTALLLLFLSLLILAVVFLEIFHQGNHAMIHVIINSLMPLSFVMIVIAVGGFTGKFIYGFFSILLCFLWLDTRIQLSKYHHNLLCTCCSESCKMFTTSV